MSFEELWTCNGFEYESRKQITEPRQSRDGNIDIIVCLICASLGGNADECDNRTAMQ